MALQRLAFPTTFKLFDIDSGGRWTWYKIFLNTGLAQAEVKPSSKKVLNLTVPK
jgi:hypothetical protein